MSQIKGSPKSQDKHKKKSKKDKIKFSKDDIGEPFDFEYIRGSNKHVLEILRQAGVTNKNFKNTADRAIINYFIELTSVEDREPKVNYRISMPAISEYQIRKPIKRPTQPPPPPPTRYSMGPSTLQMTGLPPPPLPPLISESSTPLINVAQPKKELPAVTPGIDALLNEIKLGLKLKSIQPNQRVKVQRENSDIFVQALRNALSTINNAKRDSSTDDDDSDQAEWPSDDN